MIKKLITSFELKEPNLASMTESEKEACSREWRAGMISIIKKDDKELLRYMGELKNLMRKYYITCKRHMNKKDYAILFWGKNNSGYTYNVDNAGLYDHDDITNRFSPSRHCDDAPIEDYIVDDIKVKSVIDRTVLGNIVINNAKNRKLLNIKLKELLPGDTNWNYRAFSTPEEFLKINENTINLINQIKVNIENKES